MCTSALLSDSAHKVHTNAHQCDNFLNENAWRPYLHCTALSSAKSLHAMPSSANFIQIHCTEPECREPYSMTLNSGAFTEAHLSEALLHATEQCTAVEQLHIE